MGKYILSHRSWIFCMSIVLLALFLRLYQLSSVPPGLHVDEISYGYNAFSLLHTGKDEYGVSFPVILRAYDDYRPALMSYLMVPFIQLFGLTVLSIRLVSVALFFLALFSLYRVSLDVLSLSDRRQKKYHLSIAAAVFLLFAISPWSVYLSRLAIETNAGVAFFLAGFSLFLRFLLYKRTWQILVSTCFFALSFAAYNGIRFFLPFFLIACILCFYTRLRDHKKTLLSCAVLFFLLLTPYLLSFRNSANLNRFTYLSILTRDEQLLSQKSALRSFSDRENRDALGLFFDNRRFTAVPVLISNYLANLNPAWLYEDDAVHEKYKVPDSGLLYLFELPLFFLGWYFIIRKKILEKNTILLLIAWIILSLLPASLTIDTPSAVRIYTLLPALLFVEGIGLYEIYVAVLQQRYLFVRVVSCILIGGSISISFLWFFHAYFSIFPREFSRQYSYGVFEALSFARQHQSEFSHICVSNRGDLSFSYIYYLFLTKYDPKKYIQNSVTVSGSFSANHIIGKYAFLNPDIYEETNGVFTYNPHFFSKNTLYIVDANDIPPTKVMQDLMLQKVRIIKKISYPDGQDAIVILASL